MYASTRRVGRSIHGRSSTSTRIGAVSAASTRRSRLATAMANGSTSRCAALDGQRRADGRGARRSEVVDAVEHAGEQLGEARPGELDLGLDAPQADHAHAVGDGAVGELVEQGRLADPRLTDDGARPAVAVGGPGRHGEQLGEDVVTAAQHRSSGVGGSAGSATSASSGAAPGRCGRRRPTLLGRCAAVASRDVGFSRAELEAFRDATVPDLVGPGLRLLFVGHQPGPVDGGHLDPLRPSGQPLLPGAAARRRDRPGHRPRHRHDRRRPAVPRRAGDRHHQPRRPGHAAGVGADGRPSCATAATACAASSPSTGPASSPSPA